VTGEDLVDRVVRTVDYQTGGKQPEAVRVETILVVLGHAGFDHARIRGAINDALEQGRLVECEGRIARIVRGRLSAGRSIGPESTECD